MTYSLYIRARRADNGEWKKLVECQPVTTTTTENRKFLWFEWTETHAETAPVTAEDKAALVKRARELWRTRTDSFNLEEYQDIQCIRVYEVWVSGGPTGPDRCTKQACFWSNGLWCDEFVI